MDLQSKLATKIKTLIKNIIKRAKTEPFNQISHRDELTSLKMTINCDVNPNPML